MDADKRAMITAEISTEIAELGYYGHYRHGKLYPESYWQARLGTLQFWLGSLGFLAAAFFALSLLFWNLQRDTMRQWKACLEATGQITNDH